MTLSDLFFLMSVLFVLVLSIRIAVSAIRRRWQTTGRLGRFLGLFVAFYVAALIAVALFLPRRFYAPGERRCFDDWCIAAVSAQPANNSTDGPCGNWIAAVEVSSVARRVRQRAPDARAELEDQQGKRYQPCAADGSGRSLSGELGPGESFSVSLPFRLPAGATPAGLVVHHGDIPGIAIVGEDQSLLHTPALQRLTLERQR